MRVIHRYFIFTLFILMVAIFFRPFLLNGLLPISSDTIVGLYHPFRDLYIEDYPNGIPFKNFLITDPVRQLIPWRELAIDLFEMGELPLWNPYAMAGTPLLANFQAAAFYPLNIFFFFLPFVVAWTILIISQPLLVSLFMYLYLRNLELSKVASLLGGLAFSFSGFFVAWMEWGTIGHTILWLPLILLSTDKILLNLQDNSKFPVKGGSASGGKIQNLKLVWVAIFIFSLSSSFFAGHLQTFFYVFIISLVYFFVRWIQFGKKRNVALLFIILSSLFIILSSMQWIPTLQLISESARSIDLDWKKEGWFIPIKHLVQFVAPDFFGNPTTLNYTGVWNYAEFIGYIGIVPLVFALFAVIFRRDKKTWFFAGVCGTFLFLAVQNPIAALPYKLNLPFISTSQPTRMLGVIDFSLVVLASLGFDLFFRKPSIKKILYILAFLGLLLVILWGASIVNNLEISKRNLILPTMLFIFSSLVLVLFSKIKVKAFQVILMLVLFAVIMFDLLRFAEKFTPFTKSQYLFPQTKTIEFLKKQEGQFRIMTTDDKIFPPNFSIAYRIQSIDGYDPLYIRRYGELIAASERGTPNISPPFGFNRIITPQNYESKIIDLLGVRYVLSLSDINSQKSSKVFQEGKTRIYENKNAFPRAFFVEEVREVQSKEEAISALFTKEFDPKRVAVVEGTVNIPLHRGNVKIKEYSENKIILETENIGDGFLVLTDSFYPSWKVSIDGIETKIYRTNYHFRGVIVPKGTHTVTFSISLL